MTKNNKLEIKDIFTTTSTTFIIGDSEDKEYNDLKKQAKDLMIDYDPKEYNTVKLKKLIKEVKIEVENELLEMKIERKEASLEFYKELLKLGRERETRCKQL